MKSWSLDVVGVDEDEIVSRVDSSEDLCGGWISRDDSFDLVGVHILGSLSRVLFLSNLSSSSRSERTKMEMALASAVPNVTSRVSDPKFIRCVPAPSQASGVRSNMKIVCPLLKASMVIP